MSIQKFSTKDPQEIIQYTFDFSLVIPNGTESIISTAWGIVPSIGSDALSAAMLLDNTKQIAGKLCSIYVQNGVSGNQYILSCLALTSLGQEIKISGLLPVRTFA